MQRNIRTSALAALLTTAFLLSACAAQSRRPEATPPMTPTQVHTEPEARYANPGSMFSAAEAADLYADNRARRVGDIVLIKVVESSKSKSKADTTAEKETDHSLGISALFGLEQSGLVPGSGGKFAGSVGATPMLSTSNSSNLSATGETKRENYVTATIGARVLQVLPGNILQLEGVRQIRVNDETQYMVVSGLVRAQDVASDNSVESTQLADSKVEYFGEGVLADKQRPGWFTRFLDNVWPF